LACKEKAKDKSSVADPDPNPDPDPPDPQVFGPPGCGSGFFRNSVHQNLFKKVFGN
jgi:hypothetical protein